MAKGKKSKGKNYVSKGIVGVRKFPKDRTPAARLINQLRALEKGRDVVVTIPNPNPHETAKRFIKQRISGREFLKRRQGTLMKEVDE